MERFFLPAGQGPVHGPITLQAHERAEARAAEEAARQRHCRRAFAATQILGHLWQLADNRPAHRPSKEDQRHRVQRARLAQDFAEAPTTQTVAAAAAGQVAAGQVAVAAAAAGSKPCRSRS